MLKCQSTKLILSRYLSLSAVARSKISKRRKDTKLKQSPNLRDPNVEAKQGKPTPTKLARDFFDTHYKQTYGSEWHSIRLALFSKPKFAALVNNLSVKDEIIHDLKTLGCLSLKELYNEEVQRLGINVLDYNQTPQQIKLPSYDDRPSMQDLSDFEEPTIEHISMSKEDAKDRLIDPENIVMGGKESIQMYEFVPSKESLGLEDFVEEQDYYEKYSQSQNSNSKFEKIPEGVYEFPDKLEAFIHPYGVFDHFRAPTRPFDGAFNYYCLDAASLIPVLMLDLKKGDELLDMCAGPGGKSLAAMQTFKPKRIVCNDIDGSRVTRVKHVMQSYLCNRFNEEIGMNIIQYSKRDGQSLPNVFDQEFDKVLCDVPCYTDRHTLFQDDNNIFKSHMAKERLRMPELQASLLLSSIKCLKPGGSVVYSTCTLSPMQNDGVISLALKFLWEETSIDVSICDLSETIKPYKPFLNFSSNSKVTRFGQQITPSIGENFGPMYIAKIRRLT